MGNEINQMIQRVVPQLQAMWLPILAVSVAVGLTFIIVGLFRLAGSGSRAGGYRSNPFSLSNVMILAGFVLVSIPAALDTITFSTMQQSSMQHLSYVPPAGAGKLYLQLAVYMIQLIGLCGFIRGWSLVGSIDKRDGVFWKAVTHIIFGAWAVNIIGFFRMAGVSLGGPVQDAVAFTIG